MILQILKKQTGYEFTKEYKFHPDRKWRFDYANIEHKLAIEQDGGVWNRGRHVRGLGFINDMAKFNAATELGWRVLRFTPQQMNESKTYELIKSVIEKRIKNYTVL